MKTPYNEIVNVGSIGSQSNPISLNDILKKANAENITPANEDKERVLFLAIDVQQDFMDNGALGVPGAHGDVERMTRFIYDNMDKITNIAVSIDTHIPQQIFHPCWWIDKDGNHPDPYTVITLADLDSGKWRAIIAPSASREYVQHLEFDTAYNTGGCTALYDTIIEGADKLKEYRDFLKNEGMRVKAVFAIFSDGLNNIGNGFSPAKCAVDYMNKEEIVTAFISFGGEATQTAKDLGFRNILDVSSSASELRRAFNCLSKSVIENSKSAVSKQDDFFDV